MKGFIMRRLLAGSTCLVLLLGISTLAFAGGREIAESRLASYRELGAAFKNVNDAIRSGYANPTVMRISARTIGKAAEDQYNLFPAGSAPGSGVKTKALAKIWANPSSFRSAQDAFAREAAVFQASIKSGNLATMKAAARDLGRTCKSCHDEFRAD